MVVDFIEQEDWSGSIYMWITSGIWVTNANIWINFFFKYDEKKAN